MRSSARAAGGGTTWSEARGCGARGRSWGAFCEGVEEGAREPVWKTQRGPNHHISICLSIKPLPLPLLSCAGLDCAWKWTRHFVEY